LSNSDETIFEPKKAVTEASINPVIRAERNRALSVVYVEILNSSINQKIKNPGAEKNKETKAMPIISATISL